MPPLPHGIHIAPKAARRSIRELGMLPDPPEEDIARLGLRDGCVTLRGRFTGYSPSSTQDKDASLPPRRGQLGRCMRHVWWVSG